MDASVARQQIKDAIIKIQQYLIRWDGKVITTGLWDVATNTAYKKARNIESDRLIVKGMIMSLQSLINQLLNDHVIVVDGVYGKLTHAAYVELLKSIKPLSMTESFTNSWDRAFSSVTTLLTKRVVPEEHNFEKGIEVPSGRRYLSEAEIRPFISHALARLPHSVAEVNVEVVLKFIYRSCL